MKLEPGDNYAFTSATSTSLYSPEKNGYLFCSLFDKEDPSMVKNFFVQLQFILPGYHRLLLFIVFFLKLGCSFLTISTPCSSIILLVLSLVRILA